MVKFQARVVKGSLVPFAHMFFAKVHQFFVQVYDAISRLFEPVLRPIRRILPDTGAIDFSPMVLLLALYAIVTILESLRPA